MTFAYAAVGDVPTNDDLDATWLIMNAQGVFLMQVGFLLLEVGSVRASHAKAICVKNTVDFLITTLMWLCTGYGVAFGAGDGNFFGDDKYFGIDIPVASTEWAGWFFQWSFVSTACTIVSGAGAERCNFFGYILCTMMISALVYPVIVRWVWGGSGNWLSSGEEDIAFVDFAGSGVVHMVGGIAAFTLAIAIGPRDGRFNKGEVNTLQPHNQVLAAAGALIIIAGWFAFNGGSVLVASGGGSMDAGRVCVVTAIGAACGGIVSFMLVWYHSHFISLPALLNDMLGGCVSVSAGPHVYTPIAAAIVGMVGGIIVNYSSEAVLYIEVDDPIDAFPVHGLCGAWGCLAVGMFGSIGMENKGFFYGDGDFTQFKDQLVGVLAIAAWTSCITAFAFTLCNLKSKHILRTPLHIELSGDLILYGGSAYPAFSSETTPPNGDIAMVSTDVQDSTALWEWNDEAMLICVEEQYQVLRDNVKRFNGYECMDEGDSLTIAFHSTFDAFKFCLISQDDLMNVAWPEEIYAHPSCAKEGSLWCGPRIRMALHCGFGEKFINQTTSRIAYQGPVLDGTAALLKAVVAGGIVVISWPAFSEVQTKYKHRLSELGFEIHIQDLGRYILPGMDDEPLGLVQVMPQALSARPATTITSDKVLMRSYATAPGFDGGEVVFMVAAFKGGPDGAEKDALLVFNALLSETVFRMVLPFDGYITKDSNGIFLLAFTTADNAIGFVKDITKEFTSSDDFGALSMAAGIHKGQPTSMLPNKASGRADYLGSPVNTTARLMALACDKRADLMGGTKYAVIASPQARTDSADPDALTELPGKFSLKGVSEAIIAYQVMV